jgi:penicillin-binding protein 1A
MAEKIQKEALKKSTKILFSILFWVMFILGIGSLAGVFILINNGKLGTIPPYEEIENPKNSSATQIFSADYKVIGAFYYAKENRIIATYDELPTALVDALIATEDVRYLTHSGIDFRSLGRVLVKGLIMGDDDAGGGSTITQQLAKLLYTNLAKNKWERAFQKLNEWVIAVKLERYFTKQEIIAMYFNKYDFLYNAVGIKKAAKVYFGKDLDELSIEECAVFVGMCKNPILYNPKRNPDNMLGRRNVVLGQMQHYGYLSEAESERLKALPINLEYHRVDHRSGIAPYFREYVRKTMHATKPIGSHYYSSQSFLEDSLKWKNDPLYGWLEKNRKPDGSKYGLYTDGLRIYSTIDSRMQHYANKAMKQHLSEELQPAFFNENEGVWFAPYDNDLGSGGRDLKQEVDKLLDQAVHGTERYRSLRKKAATSEEIKTVFDTPVEMTVFSWSGEIDTVMSPLDSIRYMKHFLRSGFLSMEPQTGHVKAYVGGIDSRYFQYDMVTQGKRQVGSTIKPFLYTMAMQEGYTPCYQVKNVPYTSFDALGRAWTAEDTGKKFRGEMVSLKWGLANSNNHISSWLMQQFKPESLAKLIHSFGIVSFIDPVLSMCLGPADISLEEMVGAYSTFANKGVYSQPIFVTRIEDKNGNVISSFTANHKEVIDEKTAYLINLLEGVVQEGTANRLQWMYGLRNEIGGKTGTSQNQSDGWFMGITPNLVSGSWVGGEERSIHFDYITLGQGARAAMPIWALYMQQVYADSTLRYSTEDTFEEPLNFNINLNCNQFSIQNSISSQDPSSAVDEDFFFN